VKKEKIIEKIKSGELKYSDVSIFKRNDPEIIYAHIQVATEEELVKLAKSHGNELDIMNRIIAKCPEAFRYASKKLRGEYDFALRACEAHGANYAHVSKELKNDKTIILSAIREDNDCVVLLSDELLYDYEIALELVCINDELWDYVDASLRHNGDFLRDVASYRPLLLRKFDVTARDDMSIVTEAVAKDGRALEFASDRIKNMETAVIIAISNEGEALEFASHRLRGDLEIVSTAIDTCPMALEFANFNLQDDEELVTKAILKDPRAVQFISKRLLHDDKFLRSIIKKCPEAEETIREVRKIEARSYKLKSIKSDDVQIRNGKVFGVKPSNEQIYNEIMKKSFTKFLDGLTHEELLVLDRLIKADANVIVEKIKKDNKKDLSERDLKVIATYRKIYLRVKQLKLDEENYDRSKVDMPRCYRLVDQAYKLADRVILSR